jgi:DNA-binding transcriptional MerR regulator
MKLTAGDVARLVGVHVETVRSLEKRGVIQSQRDLNNWRRFSPDVVDKLKRLYSGAEKILQSEAGSVTAGDPKAED